VFPGAKYIVSHERILDSLFRQLHSPHLEANIRVAVMAFKGKEYK
jgi:hypothetical protein